MSSALAPRTDVGLARPKNIARIESYGISIAQDFSFVPKQKSSSLSQSPPWRAQTEGGATTSLLDALSQASLPRGKSIGAHYSAAAITQVYGHSAPLLIQAWTNSPADS
jgi:hypothetical protein